MSMLAEYERLVHEIEDKGAPQRRDDVGALVARICRGPWSTTEERTHAQRLVARLERLWLDCHIPAGEVAGQSTDATA